MSLPFSIPSSSIRESLPSLIRPLQRVRPNLPFFRLDIHRVPTLWGLYRGLLKNVPTNHIHIKTHIRAEFRRNRHRTGTERTISQLQRGYKLLETFSRAAQGDNHAQRILDRYNSFLGWRLERREWQKAIAAEVKEQTRPRSIVTGSLIWPTPFNPPLPRLNPQPLHITMMIKKRKKEKEKRAERLHQMHEYRLLLAGEAEFENGLLGNAEIPGRLFDSPTALQEFLDPLTEAMQVIVERWRTTWNRQREPIPQTLLDQLKEARREKIRNKTRERKREERGEILKRTLRRMRGGPPAHELSLMSPRQREEDRIIRGVSQVGYVGLIKQRHGFNLRIGKPGKDGRQEREEIEKSGKKWSVIDAEWVSREDEQRIRAGRKSIEEENERRRTEAGEPEPL